MPTKREIHEKIRALQGEYERIPMTESLRERALVVYTRVMLGELEAGIINEGIDALKMALNNNWQLVNGTALSPTAIPEADITKLFCDVAEFVADEYNKTNPVRIAAIQLLMPSITVESIRPDLFDNASKVIGEGYLNLTVRPLREILKTHILGREGQFLLPVKLLTELSLNLKIEALMNPYVPEDAMTQDIYYAITSEEYARLVAHSPLTQAVGEAHQQYQRLANDNSNLLGQLNQLCVKLAVNDAHGGIGSEENAGTGAYVPIIIFNDYYDKLTAAQKNSLPKPLIQEIEKLLTLASNPEENINATANFQTCIGTRRQKLQAAAQGNEAILEGISISGSQRESLISASIALFHKTKEELTRHLASSSYQYGRDNLGLNCQLLESLGLKFNLVSLEDLNIFKVLSADEMIELLQDDELSAQLITQVHSLENLVILIMELSLEKTTAILSNSKRAISNLLIRTPQDLSALLISLEPEKCAVVIDAMKSELLKLIKMGSDFESVLKHLTPEQRTAVFDSMKSELLNIIKTSHAFRDVLNHLMPEQRTVAIDAMKSELPKLIKTMDELLYILDDLIPEQCKTVIDALKSEFPKIIKTREVFRHVLLRLPPEQCKAVIDAMKNQLPTIINTGESLCRILHDLTSEKRTMIFDALKSEFPKIINTSENFRDILQYLTTDQRTAIFDALQNELPKKIKTSEDFRGVLQYLTTDQRTVIFDALERQLLKIIKTGEDFMRVLTHLTPEQRTVIFDANKNKFLNIIKTDWDFRCVLKDLTPEQRTVVINTMKKELPKKIKTGGDFNAILTDLTLEQRTTIFDAMKKELPNIIKSSEDFRRVLQYLPPEQRKAVIDAIKIQLPTIIKTDENLWHILQDLTLEQRTTIFDAIKSKLPTIFKTRDGFKLVLQCLSSEQCKTVLDAMKSQLPMIFKTSENLWGILQDLSPDQRKAVIDAIKIQLPTIIKTHNNFVSILKYLDPEQQTAVIDALKNEFPKIINTGEDFWHVLLHLTREQCTAVIDAMKIQLPTIIKTGENLWHILQDLAPEQRTTIFNAIKIELPKIIKTHNDFESVLQYLDPEQRTEVIDALKKEFPKLIKTREDFRQVLLHLTPEQCTAVIDAMGSKTLGLNHLYDVDPTEQLTLPNELSNMITFIKNTDKKPTVIFFASAVMDNDIERIKTSLASLTQDTKRQSDFSFRALVSFNFWARKDPLDTLANELAALCPKWKDRIRIAFDLPDEISKETLFALLRKNTDSGKSPHYNDS